ncbi:MAG: TraR/DksA C4-type zinc finger protein [Candidatus Moraniibacteriota bacterium]|nr:MAG: TraR/DksA C4-type zinc finger protein [Candidatus Moranbacteria bacterium]
MTLDAATLSELKEKLLTEKSRLEEALSKFATKTDVPGEYKTQMEEIGTDIDENATEVEGYVDNLAVEQDLEHELQEVLAALDRMEKGSYGICEKTGQEINIERLRAYPAARTAVLS